ncbi:MAG: GGDEF domain-containing protein [Burkholderiales bacterium]|nr:GGDEF domain-containing protein [Burkholderiales bacterium]MDR4518532.1 GGDEF domain-containing protein [Nitrosomonas sp.]
MRSFIFPKLTHFKLPETEYGNYVYWLFFLTASAAIFLFDLYTPLGVAAGTPYALIVFASLWFKSNWSTYIATVSGISLTLIGFFMAPGIAAPLEVVLTNRILALIVITITAYMVLKIKKVNHELFELMADTYIDPLTQCKNNRAFEEETKVEIKRSKRYKRNLSLAIFDTTNTSQLNTFEKSNTHISDQQIKIIADEIRKSIRSSDQLYRIDLYRFAVLYAETDIQKAKEASDALCKKVSIMSSQSPQKELSISAGITMLDTEDSLRKLFKRAENALLIAQKNGYNQIATLPETTRTDKTSVPAILCRPRSS